jgi:predicted phosphodiesterase
MSRRTPEETADEPRVTPFEHLPTVARLAAPTTSEPRLLAAVSDPHVTPRAEGTPMVYHRSAERLATALDDAEARGVDAVVSPGDLTKDGAPREYDLLEGILAGRETPLLAVPGNHDVPKAPVEEYEHGDDHETPPVERFARLYAPDGSYPFVASVGDLDVVGLNTASEPDGSLETTHDGRVGADDLDWLAGALAEASNPVVLMHHNTPRMYDQFRAFRDQTGSGMGLPPRMRDPAPLVDTLVDAGVPLVVTGHLHNLGVAETGPVREVTTPATGSYPQGYLLFRVDPAGTVVKYVPVTDVEGMTEAHHARASAGTTSAGYAAFGAVRLARLPLLEDEGGA